MKAGLDEKAQPLIPARLDPDSPNLPTPSWSAKADHPRLSPRASIFSEAGITTQSLVRLLLFTLIGFVCSHGAAAGNTTQAWTIYDSDQAADLALATAEAPSQDGPTDSDSIVINATNLVQFACLLGNAGNVPRAKTLLFQAMSLVAPPNDDFLTRIQAIQAFMIFHDQNDAEKLANIQTEPQNDGVYSGTLKDPPSCDPNAINERYTAGNSYFKPADWDYKADVRAVSGEAPVMRVQDEKEIIISAARSKNVAAAAYTMPLFMSDIDASRRDPLYGETFVVGQLEQATEELAAAKMTDEAEITYAPLQSAMQDTSWMNGQQSGVLASFAPVQAAMGDLKGALQSADLAGSIKDDSYEKELTVVLTMSFDNPSVAPTPAEILSHLAQIRAALPKDMSWRKDEALREIVRTLAEMRNVQEAFAVEALMEGDLGDDITRRYRNDALAAIASSQVDTGDPSGALATISRISDPSDRWDPLIDLAATPIQK